jgi:ABC-type multidrug transport system fused ATPase/permease subunit
MAIQKALARLMKTRTSFVIAHRLSTVVSADRIVVIEDGRIVEQGSHHELLEKGGVYYQLYLSGFED